MRKFVLLVVFILLLAGYVYAVPPTTEEANMLVFDTAGQTTSTPYTVWNISWDSSTSGFIAVGNSMTVVDASTGTVLATTVASVANQGYQKIFPNGIKTNGVTLQSITTGKGKVYVNVSK